MKYLVNITENLVRVELLDMCDERRQMKNTRHAKKKLLKKINKKIRHDMKKGKEYWAEEQCYDME